MRTTPQYTEPLQPVQQPAPRNNMRWVFIVLIVIAVLAIAGAAWLLLMRSKNDALSGSSLQQLGKSSDTIQINVDTQGAKLKEVSNSSSATSVPIESRRAMLKSLQ